jgi:hypothetical protein
LYKKSSKQVNKVDTKPTVTPVCFKFASISISNAKSIRLLLNVRIAGLGLSVGTVTTGTEFYKCHTSTLQLLHIPQSLKMLFLLSHKH